MHLVLFVCLCVFVPPIPPSHSSIVSCLCSLSRQHTWPFIVTHSRQNIRLTHSCPGQCRGAPNIPCDVFYGGLYHPRIIKFLYSVNFSVVNTNCYHVGEAQISSSKYECFPRIVKSASVLLTQVVNTNCYSSLRNGFLTCVMYHVSDIMYHVSDPPLSDSLIVTMSQYIDHTIFTSDYFQISPIFSNESRCPPTSKYPTLVVYPKWCLYDDPLV